MDSLEGLDAAIEEARRHDLKLVIEAGIVGREIECAVLQGRGTDAPRTSMPGEIAVAMGNTSSMTLPPSMLKMVLPR